MKVLGIVFLYNPDFNAVVRNIDRYADSLSCLIVWSNMRAQNQYYKALFKEKSYFNKLLFMGDNGNDGLSKPINLAMRMTLEEGYDYLLTMDQDSIWGDFPSFLNMVSKRNCIDDIFVPIIIQDNVDINNDDSLFSKDNNDEIRLTTDWVFINSGTLYGQNAIKRIGFMNEDFFIEGIDIEYSVRAQLANVNVFNVTHAILYQNVDDNMKRHKFFKWHVKECKYNARRLYGISYSYVYMMFEFPYPYKRYMYKQLLSSGYHMLIPVIFWGDNRVERTSCWLKGVFAACVKRVKRQIPHYYKC